MFMLKSLSITRLFLAFKTKKLGMFVLHKVTDHLSSVDEE